MQHIDVLARNIAGLLDGSWSPDPSEHGLTSDEERAYSSAPNVRGSMQYMRLSPIHERLRQGIEKDTFELLSCNSKYKASQQTQRHKGCVRSCNLPKAVKLEASYKVMDPEVEWDGYLQWPGLTESVITSNSQLYLYGGAAFERCLAEFQEAASKFVFPSGISLHPAALFYVNTDV